MLLHSLRITNYRNFANLTIDFEPDCTVIVGENDAGKTNILDALYASLRVNRTVRQGAFDLNDYHLSSATAMSGDAGPIELQVTFRERRPDEWPDEVVQALRDVPDLDVAAGLQSVNIAIRSTAPGPGRDEDYDWNFVNNAGNPRPNKRFDVLNNIQKLRPLYRLNTMRDAEREFNRRSTFFSPFISDPDFDDALRTDLITSLGDINEKVLGAHDAFNILRDNLDRGAKIVHSEVKDAVRIEAVPSRLTDLLANTQVSYQGGSGATLPLERHGSGTQSLSVFSLFQAYVAAKLSDRFDPLSLPILEIEEPEAHLHPNAARSLWSLLEAMQGQKIITSHSGDLIGEVPLRCIRRICQAAGYVKCYQVDEASFDSDELRHINYQVRATRGELIFARCWLLVEGQSELCALPEIAKAIGESLNSRGVRIVEYQQTGGPVPFAKMADQLGIAWHCLVDGDASGQQNASQVRAYLGGEPERGRITSLDTENFESFMCKNGFLDIYLPNVSPAKSASIVANKGTNEFFEQVSKALIRRSKPRLALDAASAIAADPSRVPPLLAKMLRTLTA